MVATAYKTALMSALDRLAAATEARVSAAARWERMIRLARAEGHSLRSVAKAAGVSHVAIAKKERTHPA